MVSSVNGHYPQFGFKRRKRLCGMHTPDMPPPYCSIFSTLRQMAHLWILDGCPVFHPAAAYSRLPVSTRDIQSIVRV
jgi:hypothetical protein